MKRLLWLLLLSSAPSYAALVLTLSPSTEVAAADSVVFRGSIANTGLADAFLNDIAIVLTPPAGTYLTVDPNFFFANVPGVLLSGETYTGPIFRLLIALNTPAGNYSGIAAILGGSDEFALDPSRSVSFTVATPEPATIGLMLAALAGLAIITRTTFR